MAEDQYGNGSIDYNAYFKSADAQAQVEQLRFIFDPREIVEGFENYLLGKRWNAKQGKYVQAGRERLNIVGVNDLMSVIEPRISKVFSLTWFTEEEINEDLAILSEKLNDMFTKHGEEYGISIDDMDVASMLKEQAYSLVKATYNKSKNGRSFNLLIKTTRIEQKSVIEDKNAPYQKQPSSGFLGGWFGRKRRAY